MRQSDQQKNSLIAATSANIFTFVVLVERYANSKFIYLLSRKKNYSLEAYNYTYNRYCALRHVNKVRTTYLRFLFDNVGERSVLPSNSDKWILVYKLSMGDE